MSGSQKTNGPDSFPGMPGDSRHQGFGLWETLESLRSEFERRVGPRMGARMGRGDVRAAILSLLAEGPMHGYQIIQEIEKRSNGAWKPSAGSVYPTLQLLADEGVVQAKESSGRKTYSITESGASEASANGSAPWESSSRWGGSRSTVLPKAGIRLAEVVGQIARSGTQRQVDEAVGVIDDARRKLYVILAED
ncbi:MAG: PadR family transcriptional regulator [Cryobacterium sp.]|nr:PadR family transcriptional regulator [Cryobacterium sp.]